MNLYFRNTGSTSWNTASNWSLTDGGGATGSVPTAADDAFFTVNSGSCVVDVAARVCKSLDFTGYSNTFTYTNTITVSGNITYSATMTIAGTAIVTINADSTITSNGKAFTGGVTISGTRTITLPDLLTVNQILTLSGSTTFAGAAGFTSATLNMATVGLTHKLVSAKTYAVTSGLTISGTLIAPILFQSTTPGVKAIFTFTGATQNIAYCNVTDIDSINGKTIWNYGGTITDTNNWMNLTAATAKPTRLYNSSR